MIHKTSRWEIPVFLLIVATAIFFRFYHLDQTPPGLYPDEAMNGVNALEANATGNYQVYYSDNNGREGLFINLQAMSVKIFGNHPWALRGVSALIGVLTVIGLYLLTKELFEWQIAAIAASVMSVFFWHVNFSRIGFRAIMVPFIMVYLFYFLWRGLKNSKLRNFLWAGIIGGLGLYTYTAFRVVPLLVLVLFIAYWWYIKKAFDQDKYEYTRNAILRGFVLIMIVAFIVALPLGLYFLHHPDLINGQPYLFVFNQESPIYSLGQSFFQTLGMFNYAGDYNNRHNIPGFPELPWPIGIFFIIGFIMEISHLYTNKNRFHSPLHIFLFAWFFIMLLPGFLSTQAPHALRTIGVIPVLMIFTARGIWWFFKAIGAWRENQLNHPYHKNHIVDLGAVTALILILVSIGFYEYNRYFKVFANDPNTAGAFNQNYVDIANEINALPNSTPKYVIVLAPAIMAPLPGIPGGLPVSAETVIFLTNTALPEMRAAKNITYLLPADVAKTKFPANAKIFTIN